MKKTEYKCVGCGWEASDEHMSKKRGAFVCSICGGNIRAKSTFGFHPFKPMIYNDICETPILIESKKHLKRECKKHNVIAARLL